MFRTAQEALRNVMAHSDAHRVDVERDPREQPRRPDDRRRRTRLHPGASRRPRATTATSASRVLADMAARRGRPARHRLPAGARHPGLPGGAGRVIRVAARRGPCRRPRAASAQLLDRAGDIEVVGAAADGAEAVVLVADHSPTSSSWTCRCRSWTASRRRGGSSGRDPDARVVVLTSFTDRERILGALDAGALGYLLKDAEPEELFRASGPRPGATPRSTRARPASC